MSFFHSYWFKSGLFTLFQRVSLIIFGFGSFFILVRYLSKDEVGIWTIFFSITALVEVARNGLIQNALIRNITINESSTHSAIYTASFTLNALITTGSIFMLILISPLLDSLYQTHELSTLFIYYSIVAILMIPVSQFEFIQQANFQFSALFYSSFAKQGIFFLCVLASFILEVQISLVTLVLYQALGTFVALIVSTYTSYKYVSLSRAIDKKWMAKLFHYGKYVVGTNISGKLLSSIDQLMLGYFIGSSAVAVYNTCARITMLVDVPTSAVGQIVFPKSTQEAAKKDGIVGLRNLYEKATGSILAMVIPFTVFVLLFPDFIITVVAGSDYLEGVPVLRVLVFITLIIPFTRQTGSIWDALNLPKYNFIYTLSVASLNAISNLIYIHYFGMIGAAMGTLTTFFISWIATQLILNNMLKVKTWRVIGNIFSSYSLIYASIRNSIK